MPYLKTTPPTAELRAPPPAARGVARFSNMAVDVIWTFKRLFSKEVAVLLRGEGVDLATPV